MSSKPKKRATPAVNPKFFQSPKGMHDILPAQQPYWDRIAKVVWDIADFYGFSRIDTPVVEFAALYEKGVGEETDIVEKEMYTFKTKGGDVLALRPEATAGIVRAYLEHSMGRMGQPQKLFWIGPLFRHENPQAGRYRQFWQADFEIIGGTNDPLYDAQIIILFQRILDEMKIKNVVLKINSIGCKVCRPLYKKQLQSYYKNHEKELCANCQKRVKGNLLRLLDCKNEKCQPHKEHAPNFLDKLCVTCSQHFKGVLEYLDAVGVAYMLSNQLVRGFDYYSRTVFEFYADGEAMKLGALPGGGRYDYLMEMIGGKMTPAIGGAVGIERLIEVTKLQEVKLPTKPSRLVFVAHAGELAKKHALVVIERLHAAGIGVCESLARESLKAQLKYADKEGAHVAMILGQKEVYEDSIIIRDLRSGLQETFPASRMIDEVKKRLKQE